MSNIKVSQSFQPITVDKVGVNPFQKKGTLTAQLRQVVNTTTTYPGMVISNEKQDNLFGLEDFDSSTGKSFDNKEVRVAWLNVPSGTTIQDVTTKLTSTSSARIYKVLSNKPILTSNQVNAIAAGLTTKDNIASKQVVRYPDNHRDNPKGLILDTNGNVMYKCNFFSMTAKEDEDYRSALDVEVTESIQAELDSMATGAFTGVNILGD